MFLPSALAPAGRASWSTTRTSWAQKWPSS